MSPRLATREFKGNHRDEDQLASGCFCGGRDGLHAGHVLTIQIDNGQDSQNIEWVPGASNAGYDVSINVLPTPAAVLSGAESLDQLMVGWGNITGSATVALSSIANGYQLPHHPSN